VCSSATPYGVRANDGEPGHSDLLRRALLNERHAGETVPVLRPLLLDLSQEVVVDVIDDLEVSRQEVFEEGNGPALESLGQDGVVGVGDGLGHDLPCVIEGDVLLVDQDPLQLDNGESRMSVVELDRNVVRELGPRDSNLLPSSDDVAERGGGPECLLLESELLASPVVVVGVQDSSDGLGVLTLLDGPIVVSGVERLKVEASLGLCGPETDVVGVDGVVARDGAVVGHGKDLEAVGPSVRARCVSIGFAVELDSDCIV